jgi:hypothetical protein
MADRWRLCALHILSSKNNHALGCSSFVDASLFDLLFCVYIKTKTFVRYFLKKSCCILTEAEHGYASSLPMPIEDYGSSPTPSGSSSSSATTSSTTRPIKIKKNQGSRSVILLF